MLVGPLACAAKEAASKKQPLFGFINPILYAMKSSSFNDIMDTPISIQRPYLLLPLLQTLGFTNVTTVLEYNVGLRTQAG